MPGPTFGFVKLLASSGSHCTKWADEQHRQAGFESRLVPDLPLPFIPFIRAFDLVSSRVWWEAATNIWISGNGIDNRELGLIECPNAYKRLVILEDIWWRETILGRRGFMPFPEGHKNKRNIYTIFLQSISWNNYFICWQVAPETSAQELTQQNNLKEFDPQYTNGALSCKSIE